MKIIVTCGAGASSTFVAQRMRRAISAAGRLDTVEVAPISAMPACLSGADVLLIGPHLADQRASIGAEAAGLGVDVALLPADIFGDRDGTRALALAIAAQTTPATARADERNEP